jgi:hypothetical protein
MSSIEFFAEHRICPVSGRSLARVQTNLSPVISSEWLKDDVT